AQQLTAIDGLLARHLGASMTSSLLKRLDASSLCALPLPKEAVLQALAHLRVREVLDCEVAALEEHLTDRLAKREDVRLLKTVPGIGSLLAATIALEVGDIGRFANAGCFASYCRLVASTRISNGKVKGHGQSPKVATVIWPGRSWRRRCLPNAGHRRRKAFIANARPNATSSLH
ncbi:MAG TPA: transposase, partial [Burkholderiales bacterium]|nr:transposase [Burkholderiales bacterium]